jgi:hypothetical protein
MTTPNVTLEIQDLVINTENMTDLERLIKLLQELIGEEDGEVPT